MKRIVVCCDGTWQRPLQNYRGQPAPTNVVRMADRIAKRDNHGVAQIMYYDEGVGTGGPFDAIWGGAFGAGLDQNIAQAYRFLVANYLLGDEIFLFGFSRGAYTVRSLAGMIRKCGIVRRDKVVSEAAALELYRDEQHPESRGPTAFRHATSIAGSDDIRIKCIGVWDTVGALGLPGATNSRYAFHDTKLSGTVDFAFQALAVDERRKAFLPTLWTSPPKRGQTLEQAWFPGTHSDVGGGIASCGLPELAMQWMSENAERAGLMFDPAVQLAHPLRPDPLAPLNAVERWPFWLIAGGLEGRVIHTGETLTLHPAVLQRWDTPNARYRPQNLLAYFKRTGNVRGADVASGSPLPA